MLRETQSTTTKLQACNCISLGIVDEIRLIGQSGPENVFISFFTEDRYTGAPTEPIRQKFKIFANACQLYGVDVDGKTETFILTKAPSEENRL